MKPYRTFLEPATSDNNQSYVLLDKYSYGEHGSFSLALGDCFRSVTLEFNTSKKSRKRTLAKVAKIQKALDIIAEELEAE